MDSEQIIIHTDGGSRGNPGPASCAFVAESRSGILHKGEKFLGKATNNFAEYSGVLLALDWLKNQNGLPEGREIVFFLDSELIVRQINGIYKVKDQNLKTLFNQVRERVEEIHADLTFKNIPREQNKIADLLVNESLDQNT